MSRCGVTRDEDFFFISEVHGTPAVGLEIKVRIQFARAGEQIARTSSVVRMGVLDIGLITAYLPDGRRTKHAFREDGSVHRHLYTNDLQNPRNRTLLEAYNTFKARAPGSEVRVRAKVGNTFQEAESKEYVIESVTGCSPRGWGRATRGGSITLRPVCPTDAQHVAPSTPPVAPGAAQSSFTQPQSSAQSVPGGLDAMPNAEERAAKRPRDVGPPATATAAPPALDLDIALAGYVYVVVASTRDLQQYWYVGSTADLLDPYRRPRAHCGPEGSLLKRLPASARGTICKLEVVALDGVPSEPGREVATALNQAELDKTIHMIKKYGPNRVRGASILDMYDAPLSREHQMTVQHVYGLRY